MVRKRLRPPYVQQGNPYVSGGDEFCNTQFGNNNAYCQDNEISWLDWGRLGKYKGYISFLPIYDTVSQDPPPGARQCERRGLRFSDVSFHGVKALVQLLCGVRAICGRHVCGPGRREKALRPCTLRPMHIGRSLMWSCLYFRTEWNGSWRQTPGRIRLVRVPWGRRIQDSSQNRGGAGGKIGRFLKANSSSLQNP